MREPLSCPYNGNRIRRRVASWYNLARMWTGGREGMRQRMELGVLLNTEWRRLHDEMRWDFKLGRVFRGQGRAVYPSRMRRDR